MSDELGSNETGSTLPEEWFEGEFLLELPYTPGVSRTAVDSHVCCYEAVLEPCEEGWSAREIMNFCRVTGPTPEAAKEALAVELGEIMVSRRKGNLGIPAPKPLRIEGNQIVGERTTVRDGWSLFTVTPKPPDRDREAELLQDQPTPAVEEAPEAAPCRTVTLGPYRAADGSETYKTVTLGPLLSRMVGRQRADT